jgi:Na+/H+ antiporter NhaD/arsenite permease-like protein
MTLEQIAIVQRFTHLSRKSWLTILFTALSIFGALMLHPDELAHAQIETGSPLIIGQVRDTQNLPINEVDVFLIEGGSETPLFEDRTQPDGSFALPVMSPVSNSLSVRIERSHFEIVTLGISDSDLTKLNNGESVILPEIHLERVINIAFWIAVVVFVGVLALIASSALHNTLAALVGASAIFLVSYVGGLIHEDLFIFDFERSLGYIDWNVIFLVMGMMIVIAIVESTGIFQWLATFAYRISGGRMWLLLPILMLITGVASAFLDNVTTMLLMTPITVQIALAIDINPLALLMPEVMASNVIGVSTLVGTPTNILIGSFGDLSFNDFLTNLTPGVLLAFVGLILYSSLTYRREFANATAASPLLMEKLEQSGRITEPDNLKKAGVIGALMLVLFILGERFHLLPAVTALMGATALLVWMRPNVDEMIDAVDWTTLVFFICLFIVVGAIQEVGFISYIAGFIRDLVGESLLLSMIAVTTLSAILSTVVANIPFTAAMLPVIGFLTATVPGAESKALFFCLSVGAAMGGNGSLIGASANMVTAGIADSAGFPISYSYFLRKGFPAMLVTVTLALIWLLIRFT